MNHYLQNSNAKSTSWFPIKKVTQNLIEDSK